MFYTKVLTKITDDALYIYAFKFLIESFSFTSLVPQVK